MKSHILIPIKDIEEKIKRLSEDIKLFAGEENNTDILEGRLYEIKEQLVRYKQISLDEKDIEETNHIPTAKTLAQMNNYAKDDDTFLHGCVVGYKQALKDLL